MRLLDPCSRRRVRASRFELVPPRRYGEPLDQRERDRVVQKHLGLMRVLAACDQRRGESWWDLVLVRSRCNATHESWQSSVDRCQRTVLQAGDLPLQALGDSPACTTVRHHVRWGLYSRLEIRRVMSKVTNCSNYCLVIVFTKKGISLPRRRGHSCYQHEDHGAVFASVATAAVRANGMKRLQQTGR